MTRVGAGWTARARRAGAVLLPCLALALPLGPAAAQDAAAEAGKVQRIATRDGVTVPVYLVRRADAQATVVLFAGGAGGYGKIGEDGWPASDNFLIRTGKLWARYPFNVAMVGRPSDGIDLGQGEVRAGDAHAADNAAVFRQLKEDMPQPLWLVGTSMGTISAAAAAIHDTEALVAGIVLSSSVTADRIPGTVPRQALDKIRVPTLIIHHVDDACRICQPAAARQIEGQLKNAPIHQTLMVSGGSGASGNPCQALHYHGFIGMEEQAVELIARWILKPGAE
ncbi:alpha/beta hydrolase [Propionivibrio sp.]|uniref:alpha/beta hydrolase n=1 Tax=Propionivibrio sp. TaxID=2212460 RepID=UPI0039E50DAA